MTKKQKTQAAIEAGILKAAMRIAEREAKRAADSIFRRAIIFARKLK